ncbi:MAG: glycosyltransferase family 39 protein [Candidatus Rokubacteria bacterium]|nr:glycosyltransferase family 39 protein [Candidatus Rokubacteria bacterium]
MTPARTDVAAGSERVAVAFGARHRDLALLLAVALPLLFAALGVSFLDPDEGLYADIPQTMVATGDWVLPRFNGLPYVEKPPLTYWATAAAMALFGDGEAAVRLSAAVAALGTVLLTWRIGRRLYGPAAGLYAGFALATTAGYALYVRKASTDMIFVLCLTLTLYGFLRDVERPDRGTTRFLLVYLGAALSLLTKGLIGMVFPLAVIGIALAWRRAPALRELNVGRGLALFALLALPWHLALAWRDPALMWFYVVDNQILRFLGARGFVEDDVPVGAVALLLLSFVWFFPWSVFAFARPGVEGGGAMRRWRPVMVVWVLVVLAFFLASRSRLEYYALPAFPALAVLVGAAWTSGRDIGRWLVPGVVGCGIVGAALVWVGARLTPEQALYGLAELNVYYRILREQQLGFPFASPAPFGALLQGLGVALVVGWAVAAACWWTRRRRAAFAVLAAEGAVILVLIVQLLHLVEPHHSAEAVAEAINARAGAGDVVAHEGSLEYSAALPFYTGRRVVVVDGIQGDLETASRRPEARGWFVEGAELGGLWDRDGRVFLVTQRPRERSHVAGLPAERVHLIGRYGSRWLYSNRGN